MAEASFYESRHDFCSNASWSKYNDFVLTAINYGGDSIPVRHGPHRGLDQSFYPAVLERVLPAELIWPNEFALGADWFTKNFRRSSASTWEGILTAILSSQRLLKMKRDTLLYAVKSKS